ncbi:MAG: hypothetical protein DRO14_00445 [Thermoprotei archaeon]|nr:MAG: hypothetical protein DRO14_00445 [Thermoprotei archaeon]
MPKIVIDLSNAESAWEAIPSGKYVAQLLSTEERESSSGNPMLVWQWEIALGEHAGRQIRSYTSLQEHALFNLKQHIAAFVKEELDGVWSGDTDDFVGRRALLTITTERRRGRDGEERDFNRVSRVEPLDSEQAPRGAREEATRSRKQAADDDDNMPPF